MNVNHLRFLYDYFGGIHCADHSQTYYRDEPIDDSTLAVYGYDLLGHAAVVVWEKWGRDLYRVVDAMSNKCVRWETSIAGTDYVSGDTQEECLVNTVQHELDKARAAAVRNGRDPEEAPMTKTCHDDDCSIHDGYDEYYPASGICTCGYGLECERMGDHSQLYSRDRQGHIDIALDTHEDDDDDDVDLVCPYCGSDDVMKSEPAHIEAGAWDELTESFDYDYEISGWQCRCCAQEFYANIE